MNNGRPLTIRKKVQLMLALTILAWATQTLFAQWGLGAEAAARSGASPEQFVPRDGGALAGASLELRGEARVFGAEVKLKQVCRWSDADKATYAPVADLVLVKLDGRRPFRVLDVKDVRQLLEEAGVNVALVRFSGPVECTVSRTDVELKEGEALEQWIQTHEQADEILPKAAPPGGGRNGTSRPAKTVGGGARGYSHPRRHFHPRSRNRRTGGTHASRPAHD